MRHLPGVRSTTAQLGKCCGCGGKWKHRRYIANTFQTKFKYCKNWKGSTQPDLGDFGESQQKDSSQIFFKVLEKKAWSESSDLGDRQDQEVLPK